MSNLITGLLTTVIALICLAFLLFWIIDPTFELLRAMLELLRALAAVLADICWWLADLLRQVRGM
ncbi:MAG: hypothetical protein AB4911_00870 [Oscillochloridaceae bacterium umkhey_bin13]